jgi:hypothetical protein
MVLAMTKEDAGRWQISEEALGTEASNIPGIRKLQTGCLDPRGHVI